MGTNAQRWSSSYLSLTLCAAGIFIAKVSVSPFLVGGGSCCRGGGDGGGDVYLEFTEGSSNKFWKLKLLGCTTMVTYGPIGKVSYISVAYTATILHTCARKRTRGREEERKRGKEGKSKRDSREIRVERP